MYADLRVCCARLLWPLIPSHQFVWSTHTPICRYQLSCSVFQAISYWEPSFSMTLLRSVMQCLSMSSQHHPCIIDSFGTNWKLFCFNEPFAVSTLVYLFAVLLYLCHYNKNYCLSDWCIDWSTQSQNLTICNWDSRCNFTVLTYKIKRPNFI